MTKRSAIEVLRTNLEDHPAVEAWRRIQSSCREPASIEVLREDNKKRAIYRLAGVGLNGGGVIAKRCRMTTGKVERLVYEEMLPFLPVTAPHYFGFLEEDDTTCWLFLEDLGTERFSPRIAEHRSIAARWLGVMHTAAARLSAVARLPNRGPTHYLEHLQSGRRTILQNLANPALSSEDGTVLRAIVSQCDALETDWHLIDKCCEQKPTTLVHGDFRPKNIYVRLGGDGTCLFPIDWETAGHGVPAADLAPSSHRAEQHVDLSGYCEVVSAEWPNLDMSGILQLVWVGRVFRYVASIDWASVDLPTGWTKRPVAAMRVYHDKLMEVMQAPPW